jgi:predicted ATPase
MPRTSIITPEKFASFGELLRFLRRRANLTQRELSIAVGYSESQISRLEKNERAPEEATLAARFVPALYVDDEPQWVARLLELGAATHAHTSEADALLPIAEAKPTPHNLPIQLTSFIGREKEIAELKQHILKARLVTLTGPGGCGKTRLALQSASGLLDDFPDGVWLIELAPLAEPALLPQTLATVLGLKEELGRPLLFTLTNHLHGKKSLLILDNCEHLVDAIAHLAESLLHTCKAVHILVTSREALGVAGEITFLVPSLSSPDPAQAIEVETLTQYESVRLFVDRAATVLLGFTVTNDNAPAVAQVCHRLDGIPLAIELAAARVNLLRVEQIATRLNDRFRLLTNPTRTALPRHQTLQAAIDWSHDLLTESERILLRRLSIFAGEWMLEAAEVVCGGDDLEQSHVLDLLTQLMNKSLVITERRQGEEARYRMLETIRQYALERLTTSGEVDAVREKHATYYLAQAEAELFGRAFHRLEQKHDNFRTALAWSLSAEGNAELGLRLVAAVSGGMFPAEARRWLESSLARADMDGTNYPQARARAFQSLGDTCAFQGDYMAAQEYMTESLKLFQELGDRPRIAWTHNRLGWLAREQGNAVTARAQLEESIVLYRELDDRENLAIVLITLGEVAVMQEDTEWATAFLEEGLALMKEQDDPWGLPWALNHLGHVAQVRGDCANARRLHEESMGLWGFDEEPEPEHMGIAWGLQSLGETALAEGKAALATEHLTHGLKISWGGGYRAETAWCLAGLAGVAALNEEPERAAWLWGAAENLRQSIGARPAPAARATHERLQVEVRKQLGEAAFNEKWVEGQAASMEQAIADALAL